MLKCEWTQQFFFFLLRLIWEMKPEKCSLMMFGCARFACQKDFKIDYNQRDWAKDKIAYNVLQAVNSVLIDSKLVWITKHFGVKYLKT